MAWPLSRTRTTSGTIVAHDAYGNANSLGWSQNPVNFEPDSSGWLRHVGAIRVCACKLAASLIKPAESRGNLSESSTTSVGTSDAASARSGRPFTRSTSIYEGSDCGGVHGACRRRAGICPGPAAGDELWRRRRGSDHRLERRVQHRLELDPRPDVERDAENRHPGRVHLRSVR